MSRVLIVGAGYVGRGMGRIFKQAAFWDPLQGMSNTRWQDYPTDLAIICVPTPQDKDGSCDTHIVEEAISELPATVRHILIKSTVTPGTTRRLESKFDRSISFSPEYMGEGTYWQPPHFPDPAEPVGHGFMVLGGEPSNCADIIDIFLPVLGPNTRYRVMSSFDAEHVKYFENAFLAFKVMYANEMRQICAASGANYHVVREGWLDDPRVGTSHSVAFKQKPGFDGKCLPKDTAALRAYARSVGIEPRLLDAMIEANAR